MKVEFHNEIIYSALEDCFFVELDIIPRKGDLVSIECFLDHHQFSALQKKITLTGRYLAVKEILLDLDEDDDEGKSFMYWIILEDIDNILHEKRPSDYK